MLNNFDNIQKFLIALAIGVFFLLGLLAYASAAITGPIIAQKGFACFLYETEEDVQAVLDIVQGLVDNVPGTEVIRDEVVDGRSYFWVENKRINKYKKITWADGMICEANGDLLPGQES